MKKRRKYNSGPVEKDHFTQPRRAGMLERVDTCFIVLKDLQSNF